MQKMVLSAKTDGGEICTVIDEGVLNTETAAALRAWLLKQCELLAVVRLPEVTFKPNKITVRSSVLYMRRRTQPDEDFSETYNVRFIDVRNLGYIGSGDAVRGFDEAALMAQIEAFMAAGIAAADYADWRAFSVPVAKIAADPTTRFDLKYWDPAVTDAIAKLKMAGAPTLASLATIPIVRGDSPPAEAYVDQSDGYALVLKAGTNISKFGEVNFSGDFIEKNVFEEYEKVALKDGDVLVSSTGTGTLGKSAVFRVDAPAIADGHVAVIRVDQEKVYPEFLCDYIRLGFGSSQIQRLYTGSTGLIELGPDQVGTVLVELPDLEKQKEISLALRQIEAKYRAVLDQANKEFRESLAAFFQAPPPDAEGPASLSAETALEDLAEAQPA